ncbi:MAG: family 20 glycosylhydrolase [Flavobacteriaceae bacterium]|nr:family 20 glycosylhydrolase [Flavobacteriaceae bacterium]
MKHIIFLIFLSAIMQATSQTKSPVSIIPEPVSIKEKLGFFKLPNPLVIAAPEAQEVKNVTDYLSNKVKAATGYAVTVDAKNKNAAIQFVILKQQDAQLGTEGYRLNINDKNVSIEANQPQGLFYGMQSLLQLFPPDIEANQKSSITDWKLPQLEIVDYPRFGWRGLMLDVARHFFTKEEVMQYIDVMAKYKYNLLHWHLTEDEGWRIEIKSLPKLTEVGAWRIDRTGTFGNFKPIQPGEKPTYGGFYTQEDIKEVVAYAKKQFVDILPEIDVPGHSLAAIVAYPELSCTKGVENYHVRYGEQIMDWSQGHPPIAMVDNTLCPANEKVYEFMEKVVTEVAQLFPFEYIHLGGDEAPMNFWEKSEAVQALMKREKLTNIKQAQGYFTNRVEKIVASHGKKMIGWDEILEGGVPKSAAVMSWRGMKGGIEAAKEGHEVVMSPTTFTYIDYMQADRITEPPVYATLRLNKTYEFDPLPDGVEAKYIKGGQANLWTEQIYNIRQAEYMTWPRGFAIAESVWSPKEKKNWQAFAKKVEAHFPRFDSAETKYARAMFDPEFRPRKNAQGRMEVVLRTELDDLTIHYSFDNSEPDHFYPSYQGPLLVPIDAFRLRVVTYRGKERVGRVLTMPIAELERRLDDPDE